MARADLKYIIGFETNDSDVVMATKRLNNLQKQVKFLSDQQEAGNISASIMRKGQKQLNDEIARLRTATAQGGQALRDYITQVDKGGKALRRKEIAAQQAGYQVQDFIVQVQGGTNPLVAFSQQASQLAGFFAGPWGAMIGLGIAAVSGLVMAFQGASRASNDLKEDLEKDIDSINEKLRELNTGLNPMQQRLTDELAAALAEEELMLTRFNDRYAQVARQGAPEAVSLERRRLEKATKAREEAEASLDRYNAKLKELNDLENKRKRDEKEAQRIAAETRKALGKDPDELTDAEKEAIKLEEYLKKLGIAYKRRTELAMVSGEAALLQKQENEQLDLHAALLAKGLDVRDHAYLKAVQQLKTAQAEELTQYRILEAEKQRTKNKAEQEKLERERYQRLLKELQNELTIAKTMQQAFSDAFHSMAEGTKTVEDAFKDMARAIIKQLYDILIVQQLVGQYTLNKDGTTTATGIVGAIMKSFDGGGYTGSGSRSGGLDGKGGFMAMLHPNETVIDHTKGQSSGVVVNQTFNFSANGDESVKKIIASEAPKIANMTQQKLMDSRRRGGNMKQVFA